MSIERVREYFKQFGIEKRIIELEQSSATVELAGIALNCNPDKIAKTLSFDIHGKYILILTSGNAKIDNHKYKDEFCTKAKMLRFEKVETIVGHGVGGVCPFGINKDIDVYLDISLKRHNTVFPACGSANSAIELTIEELEKYSNYKKWINVCK